MEDDGGKDDNFNFVRFFDKRISGDDEEEEDEAEEEEEDYTEFFTFKLNDYEVGWCGVVTTFGTVNKDNNDVDDDDENMNDGDTSISNSEFIVIGTAVALPGQTEAKSGRLLVFEVFVDGGKKAGRLVFEKTTRGGVYSVDELQGLRRNKQAALGGIVCGINSKVNVYSWTGDALSTYVERAKRTPAGALEHPRRGYHSPYESHALRYAGHRFE